MQILYDYIAYCIGNKLNIISFIIQVNATDISAHCDTMSQNRSLNTLYLSILNKIPGVDS